MGREVRRVPADWEHPRYTEKDAPHGRAVGWHIPMHDTSFEEAYGQWKDDELPEWIERREKWQAGLETDYRGGWRPIDDKYLSMTWEEYAGLSPQSPDPKSYMPDWPDEERTHYMMYEDTSEGTPISPAFATPEELARWLADTGASSFGGQTASYEAWLRVANGGYAPSAVIMNGGPMMSGVEAMKDSK